MDCFFLSRAARRETANQYSGMNDSAFKDLSAILKAKEWYTMHWINNMKIRSKLLVSSGIMVIFMGIIGYTGFRNMGFVQQALEKLFAVQMPSIDLLIEADRDLQQLLVAERSMMFNDPNTPLFQQFQEEYETNFKQSDERWNKYKSLAETAEEKAIFETYDNARQAWKSNSRKVIDLARKATAQDLQRAKELTLG